MTFLENKDLDQKLVQVIRGLIMDGTRKANSGHPGGAMSSADFAAILFKEFLTFNPEDPTWFNRDRFVLSAGHESMLLYSLLTLAGFMSLDDLKQFRQFGSKTPGHPERDLEHGIECTTGPLGQGVSMAVGMAVAEAMLSAQFGPEIVTHYTYVIAGDGDFQEPVAIGAAELAGHWGLGKLIVFYDQNHVQISGPTSRADSTNVPELFEALQWHVVKIDGHNHHAIRQAIREAQNETDRPTLIVGKTIMAKGAATMEGDPATHGSPLPPEEIAATKKKMGLPPDETFYLPPDVLKHFRTRFADLINQAKAWAEKVEAKRLQNADFRKLWEIGVERRLPKSIELPEFSPEKPIATRAAFGEVLAALADAIPTLAGGSADLEPSNSTKAFMKKVGDFTRENRTGRNLAFGVREFPMGAIVNGMALHGGLFPFGATFLVFSDYERPALRLSAMQKIAPLHVFTHDSFYLGEDGPTHQPVEHVPSLRAIPNFLVLRPADANETREALLLALRQTTRPAALILTRQKLPVLDPSRFAPAQEVERGGYILWQNTQQIPELILLATGSEVHLALGIAEKLSRYRVRVVSMPSVELFEEQPESYRQKVLPGGTFRVALEAAVPFGWEKFVGCHGFVFGLNHFGDSAPYQALEKAYGFTPENLAPVIEEKLKAFLSGK